LIAEALPLTEEAFRGGPALRLAGRIAALHCQATVAEDTQAAILVNR